jgi:hypothetical protein
MEMKKKAMFVILLLCVVGAAQAAIIEVLYEDNFDNDGPGTNTGIGGGAANRTIRNHSWVDDGDATFAVTDDVNYLNRALVYSENAFQSSSGFKLTVWYTSSSLGVTAANQLSFGLISSDTDLSTYSHWNPFGAGVDTSAGDTVPPVYSLGVSLIVQLEDGQDGLAGLKFTDGLSATPLATTLDQSGDNVDFVAGVSGVDMQFGGHHILFFSCLFHRINLDTIFFGELSVLSHKRSFD